MFTCDWYECHGWGFPNRRDWASVMQQERLHCQKNLKVRQMIALCIGFSIMFHVHPNPGPCRSDLSICHVNIRSIRNQSKVDHIACALADKFKIITLSETWLHSTCDTSHLLLQNFQQPFRRDRENNSGYGGVLAWVANDIAAKRRPDLEVFDLEAMWLEIRLKNNKCLLCVVYKPPNANYDFWTLFQESIDKAKETNVTNLVITGDLNSDPNTPSGKTLNQFADNNHLVMHIDQPTRITPDSRAILDQFLTNVPLFVRNLFVEPPVSTNDHCTIGMHLHFKTKAPRSICKINVGF